MISILFSLWALHVLIVGFVLDEFIDRFRGSSGMALLWGSLWPILGLLWLLKKTWLLLIALLALMFRPIHQRVARKSLLVARCEQQHAAYIKGLMEENDDFYYTGVYGVYQPPTEWKETA